MLSAAARADEPKASIPTKATGRASCNRSSPGGVSADWQSNDAGTRGDTSPHRALRVGAGLESCPRIAIVDCGERWRLLRRAGSWCDGVRRRQEGSRGRFFTTVDLVNRLRPKVAPGARAGSPIISPASTSSSSMNSAISPSPRQAVNCCSILSAALRAHLDHRRDQSRLRRMAERVRRPKDDHRAPRSPHAPLRHHRDRQRELALQEPRLSVVY